MYTKDKMYYLKNENNIYNIESIYKYLRKFSLMTASIQSGWSGGMSKGVRVRRLMVSRSMAGVKFVTFVSFAFSFSFSSSSFSRGTFARHAFLLSCAEGCAFFGAPGSSSSTNIVAFMGEEMGVEVVMGLKESIVRDGESE